jgi:hypothetical protein
MSRDRSVPIEHGGKIADQRGGPWRGVRSASGGATAYLLLVGDVIWRQMPRLVDRMPRSARPRRRRGAIEGEIACAVEKDQLVPAHVVVEPQSLMT